MSNTKKNGARDKAYRRRVAYLHSDDNRQRQRRAQQAIMKLQRRRERHAARKHLNAGRFDDVSRLETKRTAWHWPCCMSDLRK